MRLKTCTALICVALVGGCIMTWGDLTIVNHSDATIARLFIRNAGRSAWGPNVLGLHPLSPGDEIELLVPCGHYDVRLLNDTGAVCELASLRLCFDDDRWVIRPGTCPELE